MKTENFGLAVPDDASKPTSLPASLGDLSNSERREAPRHPFIASAEETDLASGARLTARVSELSLKGCYLDTLNPFPKGTQIRLVIFHGGATFTALATVNYTAEFRNSLMRTDVAMARILTLWTNLSKWRNWEREAESDLIANPVGGQRNALSLVTLFLARFLPRSSHFHSCSEVKQIVATEG